MERRQRGEPKMQAREGAREFLAGDTSESNPPDTAEDSPRSALLLCPFPISDLSRGVPGKQQGKAAYSDHRPAFRTVPGERATRPST